MTTHELFTSITKEASLLTMPTSVFGFLPQHRFNGFVIPACSNRRIAQGSRHQLARTTLAQANTGSAATNYQGDLGFICVPLRSAESHGARAPEAQKADVSGSH